eukprot:TRINITY_DN19056_c0_g2_i2.p1 TRINITY_DN19056_c0_g2~~TRINITY_DN19056_c0_g2_i2.p1  ORF type:complete len:403 (-),score=91.36 TRINITY_DN19056_c0_g2_i2:293-1501(-)
MLRSLVGSEMCIRDSLSTQPALRGAVTTAVGTLRPLARTHCLVAAEIGVLMEVLDHAEGVGVDDLVSAEVEGDLDIVSVAGDDVAQDSLTDLIVDEEPGSLQTRQSVLEPLGAAPWDWEITLTELTFKELVGAGSYAEVYHGELNGKQVAIKRFRTKHMSPHEHEQFLNEVHVLASLSHPNILGFEAAVATAPHFCIVTEYITPGSLQAVLKHAQEYMLPWPRRVGMACDIAAGMGYLHSFQPPIVHRDLKPSNLLVQSDGLVKVCDFGSSRQVVATGTMSVCGTPVYMAPEVLRGERYDESADLYSFGIVLWELLVREVPFKGVIPVVAGMKIAYEGARPAVPAVEDLAETSQRDFLELLVQCWAQQSEERPRFQGVKTRLYEMARQLPDAGWAQNCLRQA